MNRIPRHFWLALATWALIGAAARAACPAPDLARHERPRTVVLVSDLHLGQGCAPGRTPKCHPLEDARWPVAWRSFLDHVDTRYGSAVDLVILGDFLELWQHPDVECKQAKGERGCTEEEARQIVSQVVAAHTAELGALKAFAQRGDHRVFLVPGNHDAALLLAKSREPLDKALAIDRPSSRVRWVKEGSWCSDDRAIVGEHGHQIGPDANRFARWPEVVRDGFLERSWGENFVQTLYNRVESDFSAIDNLTPESAGIKLYIKQVGLWGAVTDIARFARFNAFQTSLKQEGSLGGDNGVGDDDKAIETAGRGEGYRLVASALPSGDPLREGLMSGPKEIWGPVRSELSKQIKDPQATSSADVLALCDSARDLAARHTGEDRTDCSSRLGGYLLAKPFGQRILAHHLEQVARENAKLSVFVFGHTHSARDPVEVPVQGSATGVVTVANTGAFQRLGDPPKGASLASIQLDSLPPCYSYVVVDTKGAVHLLRWRQDEGDASGREVAACDAACTPLPVDCGK